jgi:hypothetical protein
LKTPVGEKAVRLLPEMAAELGKEDQAWSQQPGRGSMLEVLREIPDLEKLLNEAKRKQQAE